MELCSKKSRSDDPSRKSFPPLPPPNPWIRKIHFSSYRELLPIQDLLPRHLSLVRLDANENGLGPSPLALEAIREAAAEAHRYPEIAGEALRESLASEFHVTPKQIVLGNGSTELLELLFHAFLRNRREEIVVPRYSFPLYEMLAQRFGCRVRVAADRNFAVDLESLRRTISPRTRLVFLANPNNPTGSRVENGELLAFVKSLPPGVLLAIDEAYADFLEDPPPLGAAIRDGAPIVALRTFSKLHSLASLRIGYALAPQEIARAIQKVSLPTNTNGLAQRAAAAALKDRHHQRQSKEAVWIGRLRLQRCFRELGLDCIPSSANFVMVRIPHAENVWKGLVQQGVLVRSLKSWKLSGWLRVTVGRAEELQRFEEALQTALCATRAQETLLV
ncbi:histidinol-phosphate aminotransferase [Methylacidimicrobium cyclopophantes]|uniref:Histidinol-phosphate aminotransferase n=1 Tax=Methylacidimicrobium cyclopophantes TaxID=1041766 RepID=A0A5E6MHB2_9BACT|nr:histidinol-phosphate transaminase [Methylacidimicrobium cyclopophantes]VVM05405.1 histidinol-phosphate aminotransferase [Methylacidimicrobium cyclopophantes]